MRQNLPFIFRVLSMFMVMGLLSCSSQVEDLEGTSSNGAASTAGSFSKSTTSQFSLTGTIEPYIDYEAMADASFFDKHFSAYAAECTFLKASLFQIHSDGSVGGYALAEVDVQSGGKFDFVLNKADYIQSELTEYMISTTGDGSGLCNDFYSSFVEDLDMSITINHLSTILTQTLTVKALAGSRLNNKEVGDFIRKIREEYEYVDEGYNPTEERTKSFISSYFNIAKDSASVLHFKNIFGFPYYFLMDSSPTIRTQMPTSLPEGTESAIASETFHWNKNYTGVTEWFVDGVLYSKLETFNYTPSKKHKRSIEVEQYVGSLIGDNLVDRNKSYSYKKWTVLIDNTFPANITASITSALVTDNDQVTFKVETGIMDYVVGAYELCHTFNKYGITVDTTSPPGSFSESCTVVTEQSHTVTIASTHGDHKIRLWVRDDSDTMVFAKTLNVFFDKEGPQITKVLMNPSPMTSAGSAQTFTKNPNTTLYIEANDHTSIKEFKVLDINGTGKTCQSFYSDSDWLIPTSLGPDKYSVDYTMNYEPGNKVVCVWGKDNFDNITVYGSQIEHTNFAQIEFEMGEPPEVADLKITNNANGTNAYVNGDKAKIEFTVTDNEGLANNPVEMEYRLTNGAWSSFDVTSIIHSGPDMTTASKTWIYDITHDQTFSFRIRAVDDLGFKSGWSEGAIQNAGDWEVIAGRIDREAGRIPKKIELYGNGSVQTAPFAVHPLTGDIVAMTRTYALWHYDVSEGIVKNLGYHYSGSYLADGVNLSTNSRMSIGNRSSIEFDRKGLLYLSDDGGKVWQINIDSGDVSHYAGGGTTGESNSDAKQLFLGQNAFSFDANNNMYTLTNHTVGWKIIKIAQNPDGTSGAVTVVAGNNTVQASNSTNSIVVSDVDGFLPMGTHPYYDYALGAFSSIAVNNAGTVIALSGYATPYLQKFRWNGTKYLRTTVNIGVSSLAHVSYSPVGDHFYVTNTSRRVLRKVYLDPNQAQGNTNSTFNASSGNYTHSTCADDGVDFSTFCFYSSSPVKFNKDGEMYFNFNFGINTDSIYRIFRLNKDTNKVVHLMGRKPMDGRGEDASLLLAKIKGIHYKRAYNAADPLSAPLASYTDYPEGLYFVEPDGVTFNRIDKDTNVVIGEAGDQTMLSTFSVGDVSGPDKAMGGAYSYHNGRNLSFDEFGYPWIGFYYKIYRMGPGKILEKRVSGSSYFNSEIPATPLNTTAHIMSGNGNLALAGNGVFFIGTANNVLDAKLRYLNYDTNVTEELMGQGPILTGHTPDSVVDGDMIDKPINGCIYNYSNYCFRYYDRATDRLYFREYGAAARRVNKASGGTDNAVFRYITNPKNPQSARLHSLPPIPIDTGAGNFIISLDGTKLFQIKSSYLYCTNVSDRSACFPSYGNTDGKIKWPLGLAGIGHSPDQLTWKDATILLISNGSGLIYQFKFPGT